MLKLILIGVWSVVVTAGTYAAVTGLGLLDFLAAREEVASRIETRATNVMRVPIMAEEKPAGYVLLDLGIDYDAAATASLSGKVADIAVDESFRAVYESVAVDFRQAKKTDLTALLKDIGDRLNRRIGEGAVKEIRVKEFMFVPPRKSSN